MNTTHTPLPAGRTGHGRTTQLRTVGLGLAVVCASLLAACGDSSSKAAPAAAPTTMASTTMAPSTMAPTSMAPTSAPMAALTPTGPGCSAVPASGSGSFAGMAQDPAATAASNNPLLSTLVAAVKAAGLVDTLNGTGPFTIFAPVNDAFAKIPSAQLNALLADKAKLTSVLTYHVVAGKMSSADLIAAGKVTTVNGAQLTITEKNGTLMVNGAATLCMDVPTANATVHIIDTVLVPGS